MEEVLIETVKKSILSINTTRHLGFVIYQALSGLPALLIFLYIFAGIYLQYQIGNPPMLPIVEAIYSHSYYVFTLALICFRVYWIDSMSKRTTYELTQDQLIARDRFLNDEQRTLALIDAGEVYQTASMFQKLFGVGDVSVSHNDTRKDPMILHNIENPNLAFEQISAQVAYMQNSIKITKAA